ncbi:hypothetical protein [Lentzea sp. E54]|uniref:hypothetical protein n=1 Tax=Lentzea xerophila TaxID=3435883 RepID=UPI003DA41E75
MRLRTRVLTIAASGMIALGLGSVLGTSSALAAPEQGYGDGYHAEYESLWGGDVYAAEEDFLAEPENNDSKSDYKPEYGPAAAEPSAKAVQQPVEQAVQPDELADELPAGLRRAPANRLCPNGGILVTGLMDVESPDGEAPIEDFCAVRTRW